MLTEQPVCAWPDCDKLATIDDHIIGWAARGDMSEAEWDRRENHQGLCTKHDDAKTSAENRRARRGRTVANVTLVCGPPCAGKNTYVTQHARRGDLVVDLDAILTALGGSGSHDQPWALKPLAFDARDAVLNRLWSEDHDVQRAWVILSAPTEPERHAFRVQGCRIVMVTADRVVLQRRAEHERPTAWAGYISSWLNQHDTHDVDEIVDTSKTRRAATKRPQKRTASAPTR